MHTTNINHTNLSAEPVTDAELNQHVQITTCWCSLQIIVYTVYRMAAKLQTQTKLYKDSHS